MHKKQKGIRTTVILVCLIAAFTAGIYLGKLEHVPFFAKGEYSIGIYTGDSPFKFTSSENMKNPVLTADDVKDSPAHYISDPFMLKEKDTWYMFFEVMHAQKHQGDIGLATSRDGLSWDYKQIVLDEPSHLSYPYVFKWKHDYYMIPETAKAFELRLYKAVNFPAEWSFVKTLLKGIYKDPSIFYYENRWWLFAEEKLGYLHLYYAEDLLGPWIEHPQSPIIKGDRNIARPGGRVLVLDDKIVRFAQDDEPRYGIQLRAFIITELSPTSYQEEEVSGSILKPIRTGWNADGMHHIDPQQIGENKWIACVDGYRKTLLFGLKYR